jgi:hypothetical protein
LQGLRSRSDPKDAGSPASHASGVFDQRFSVSEYIATASEQILAAGRELDPATDPVEQSYAELRLEVADLP